MSHIQQISSCTCNDLNVDAREIVVGFDSFPQTFPFFTFAQQRLASIFIKLVNTNISKEYTLNLAINFTGKRAYVIYMSDTSNNNNNQPTKQEP